MSILSDKKLNFLKTDYSNSVWYITKQNCNFRDLIFMARILELWDDNPNESFQSFFNRTKKKQPFDEYLSNTPHRALKNCEFYGLMVPSDSKSKAAYSSKNLTETYFFVKDLCKGDFSNKQKYQKVINRQIELMNIIVDKKEINPVLYTLKVLLTLGDATGSYELQTNEFKLFVSTCNEWNQYYQTVESIIRFRSDINFQKQALSNYDIANESRFNLVFDNLSYINKDTKGFSLKEEYISDIRRKVAEYELGGTLMKGESLLSLRQKPESSSFISITKSILALRTKPFLLLAGISGTGKSRIVREFAFKSCPKYLQDKDGTTPGNYCMIEVKPNWHDSTELLGYYSNLSKEYLFKKFVKFLVKAKMYPDVPFFVCLDEMNLAPVEQYFAEVLSILETRKHPRNPETKEVDMKTIKTEVIVEAKYFQQLGKMPIFKNKETGDPLKQKLTDRDIYMKLYGIDEEKDINEEVGEKTELTTLGLTLPGNVLIIGTVNMDDTTHQFSRKVIDRAMTIEMNGGNLSAMFGGSKNLEYLEDEAEQQKWQNAFTQRYISADEVLEAHPQEAETIMEKLPERLNELNKALKGTPFEVSYRVLNELTIMVGVLLDDNEEGKSIDDIINQAVDNILLMKILPRIEGDADMFAIKKKDVQYDNRLKWLESIAPDISTDGEEEEKESKQTAREKIHEMIERLDNQEFTRFWP